MTKKRLTFECPRCGFTNGLTVKEAARALGVSDQTVLNRINAGTLEADKIQSGGRRGFRFLIPKAALEDRPTRKHAVGTCPACGWRDANGISLASAADLLGTSKQTVINRIKDGTLEGYKIANGGGGNNDRFIVSRQSVQRYAKAR